MSEPVAAQIAAGVQRVASYTKQIYIFLVDVVFYGSSHTKLGQWPILRIIVFEHILSLFIFISPP